MCQNAMTNRERMGRADVTRNEFVFETSDEEVYENAPLECSGSIRLEGQFSWQATDTSMDRLMDSSSDLFASLPEPTPITNQGVFHAVDIVDSLPANMLTCCDDFIEALAHINTSVSNQCSLQNLPPAALSPISEIASSSSYSTDAQDEDPNMKIHPYQHERWMERYQDLVDYYRVRGHCNVPYVYKENPCLGQWVKRQRHQYKLRNQGQHSNLTEDRIQILDMLGFIWDSHGAAWEEKFQELKEFRNAHGHCNVPCIYNGTSKLSTWLKRQRRQYRLFVGGKPSTMDYERIAKLEGLGFVWDYYGSKSPPATK